MQWGSLAEFFCDGRVRPLRVALVWRHGLVYGRGSSRGVAAACGCGRKP